jgi:hypothetical protein
MHTYLVVREDQCIRNDNVLPSSGSEDNDLGDILAGQRLNAPKLSLKLGSEQDLS